MDEATTRCAKSELSRLEGGYHRGRPHRRRVCGGRRHRRESACARSRRDDAATSDRRLTRCGCHRDRRRRRRGGEGRVRLARSIVSSRKALRAARICCARCARGPTTERLLYATSDLPYVTAAAAGGFRQSRRAWYPCRRTCGVCRLQRALSRRAILWNPAWPRARRQRGVVLDSAGSRREARCNSDALFRSSKETVADGEPSRSGGVDPLSLRKIARRGSGNDGAARAAGAGAGSSRLRSGARLRR